MKFRPLIATALITASSFASATFEIPVSLTETNANFYSGSFSGSATTNSFLIDLSGIPAGLTALSALVSANFTGSGYDVVNATFDGFSFTPVVNFSIPGPFGADLWQYSLANVTHDIHTIVVTGSPVGNSTVGFTGSLSVTNAPFPAVTPVPEPETYVMLLAGLGLMGTIARRRNKVGAS